MYAYLTQHLFLSTWKQAIFMEKYGAMEWTVNPRDGVLIFNDAYKFTIEILGSYSKASNTWLWIWGNPDPSLPDKMKIISKKLKEWGSAKGIQEFSQKQWSVGKNNNPEYLGLLAIGLCGLPAFYNAWHDEGSILCLIKDPAHMPKVDLDNMQFINHVTNVISLIPMPSHKRALIGFCNALKWKGEERGGKIVIYNPNDENAMHFSFDESERIIGMDAIVGK